MSRVGKKIVVLPQGVTLATAGRTVTVKGPKGTLALDLAQGIGLSQNGSEVQLAITEGTERTHKAIHGTMRALLANMVKGVSDGFKKTLEITGTGYRANMDGKKLVLQLGYSHPVEFPAPEGITLATEGPTKVLITGIDRALVGQVAANIREKRPPEPYKGKGIKYEGERIRRKAGKSAGA
ncbi:MAG: 50S ribosomal protein L6 [Candidatus Eiseniibacteriota bacterium]